MSHVEIILNSVAETFFCCWNVATKLILSRWRPMSYRTSPLICSANQWIGFYMISASVVKELKRFCYTKIATFFYVTSSKNQTTWCHLHCFSHACNGTYCIPAQKKTYKCPMNFRTKVLKNEMVPQNIVVKSKREALCDSVVID